MRANGVTLGVPAAFQRIIATCTCFSVVVVVVPDRVRDVSNGSRTLSGAKNAINVCKLGLNRVACLSSVFLMFVILFLGSPLFQDSGMLRKPGESHLKGLVGEVAYSLSERTIDD